MKKTIATVIGTLVVAAVILGLVYGVRDALAHRQAAKQVALYLYSPTDVKNAKGEPLNRAALIDALLREAVAKQKAAVAAPKVTKDADTDTTRKSGS